MKKENELNIIKKLMGEYNVCVFRDTTITSTHDMELPQLLNWMMSHH